MRASPLIWSLLILGCELAYGQPAEPSTFEVASVKQSPPVPPTGAFFGPPRGGPGTTDPGQITWTFATLKSLLMTAYDRQSVSGERSRVAQHGAIRHRRQTALRGEEGAGRRDVAKSPGRAVWPHAASRLQRVPGGGPGGGKARAQAQGHC